MEQEVKSRYGAERRENRQRLDNAGAMNEMDNELKQDKSFSCVSRVMPRDKFSW